MILDLFYEDYRNISALAGAQNDLVFFTPVFVGENVTVGYTFNSIK